MMIAGPRRRRIVSGGARRVKPHTPDANRFAGAGHRAMMRKIMATSATPITAKKTPLTGNQVRGFWAAWGGWALDGMDSFIYALVMVPALRELLPRSGLAAD